MTGPITPHRDPRSNWHPDRDPVHRKVNDLIADRGKPVLDAVKSQTAQGGWAERIKQLNSNGDTARSKETLDGQVDASVPGLLTLGRAGAAKKAVKEVAETAGEQGAKKKVDLNADLEASLKAQSGHEIAVSQNGDGPHATYTVRYTKSSAAGAGADFTGGLSVGPLGGTGYARFDGQGGVANTVEMTFNKPEDAARAAESLEKLTAADMVDDAARVGKNAPTVNALLEGSPNNLMNPMSEHGEVNPGIRRAAGVSDKDMQFLGDHVTAQEFSATSMVRGNAELRGAAKGAGVLVIEPGSSKPTLKPSAAEGDDRFRFKVGGHEIPVPGFTLKAGTGLDVRVDRTTTQTRRVEYPTDTKAGKIVDTTTATDSINGKQRDILSLGLSAPGQNAASEVGVTAQHRGDDNFELANVSTSVSVSQAVAPGTHVDAVYLATTPPKLGGEATVKQTTQMITPQERSDLARNVGNAANPLSPQFLQMPKDQRLDMNRQQVEYKTSGDKNGALQALLRTAGGSSGEAGLTFGLQDGAARRTSDTVKRDGTNKTDTVRLALDDLAGGEVALTRYSGVDDYTAVGKQAGTLPKTPPVTAVGPPPTVTRAVEPPPARWQVQPYDGVNVRSSPGVECDNKVAIVQSGSYLDGTGEMKQDAEGHTWAKVKGRDQEDKMVEGWVRADLMKPHDQRLGDNDSRGRVNPQREHRGDAKVIVHGNDNLWTIAKRNHVDYEKLIAANSHLRDPSLVFEGDSVYLPVH